jgi:integrase
MASLLARHSKTCEHGRPWSRVDYTARSFRGQREELGCTCDPHFYVVANANGAGGRRSVGKNFELAKEQLTKAQGGIDRGEDVRLRDITFGELTKEWIRSLRAKPNGPKENTLRSYVSTVDYGKAAFGATPVRKLTALHVEHCLSLMTRTVKDENGREHEEPISASTRLKHLRVLSGIFRFAVRRRYAASNPVEVLEVKPERERGEAPYFTDDEIPVLLAALSEWDRPLVEFALLTGMRLGELIALRWANVNLGESVVYVREAYTDGLGVNEPKTKGSKRTVRLSKQAVALLGSLWSEYVTDADVIFPPSSDAPTLDGYRRGNTVLKHILVPAMEEAGIPRNSEHLDPPSSRDRGFHSLRHTYARVVLENGGELGWLSRQLGHSSEAVTRDVYGHWSKDAAKREVERLETAGAFSFSTVALDEESA